jgi:hypothetical protein
LLAGRHFRDQRFDSEFRVAESQCQDLVEEHSDLLDDVSRGE